jgi:two-component system sensor histidine kinase DegS
MCSRLTTEWKVPILVHINPPDLSLPISREQSLRLMLHEAVVNALKHAHPSRVVVSIDASETELSVVVIDDGRGFPFRGRLEHDVLVARAAGPVSLRDRVVALDGRLAIESSSTGSRVEFAIPVTARDGESTSHGAGSDRL